MSKGAKAKAVDASEHVLTAIRTNGMRLEMRDPRKLDPHPDNYRRHPARQRHALKEGLNTLGWLVPPIFNETSGKLLDGHLRREEAIEQNEPQIPVIVIALPLELEPAALLAIDKIRGMATIDEEFENKLMLLTMQIDRDMAELLSDGEIVTQSELDEGLKPFEKLVEDNYEIGLVPGEQFDYVVLLFRTPVDWTAAQEHFNIKPVKDPFFTQKPKIGVGRVIDGAAYLNRILRGEL
jgi:hypothetical protein